MSEAVGDDALPEERVGCGLSAQGRKIDFSFWPIRPSGASDVPSTRLFSLDPWAIIRQAIESECPPLRRAEALACLAQATAFFEVGTGRGIEAARPLALRADTARLMDAISASARAAVARGGAAAAAQASGENEACSICLADFRPREDILCRLPCGHLFHRACLADWLFIKPSCPNCRRPAR